MQSHENIRLATVYLQSCTKLPFRGCAKSIMDDGYHYYTQQLHIRRYMHMQVCSYSTRLELLATCMLGKFIDGNFLLITAVNDPQLCHLTYLTVPKLTLLWLRTGMKTNHIQLTVQLKYVRMQLCSYCSQKFSNKKLFDDWSFKNFFHFTIN